MTDVILAGEFQHATLKEQAEHYERWHRELFTPQGLRSLFTPRLSALMAAAGPRRKGKKLRNRK